MPRVKEQGHGGDNPQDMCLVRDARHLISPAPEPCTVYWRNQHSPLYDCVTLESAWYLKLCHCCSEGFVSANCFVNCVGSIGGKSFQRSREYSCHLSKSNLYICAVCKFQIISNWQNKVACREPVFDVTLASACSWCCLATYDLEPKGGHILLIFWPVFFGSWVAESPFAAKACVRDPGDFPSGMHCKTGSTFGWLKTTAGPHGLREIQDAV